MTGNDTRRETHTNEGISLRFICLCLSERLSDSKHGRLWWLSEGKCEEPRPLGLHGDMVPTTVLPFATLR